MSSERTDIVFAADSEGTLVVAADGVELLAWGGEGMLPMWKVFAAHRFAGVAVTARAVWALDDRGVLELRRRVDGEIQHRTGTLDIGGGRSVAAVGDVVAVAGSAGVVWLRDGRPEGRVDTTAAQSVVLSLSADRLLVIEAEGSVSVVDLGACAATGRLASGGPAQAALALPDGSWVVAAGRRVRSLAPDGSAIGAPTSLAEPVFGLASGADEAILVVLAGRRRVELRGRFDGMNYGVISTGRDICAVLSAGRGSVILGLAHGDLQRVDLFNGSAVAAPPHEGRARIPWPTDINVDSARIRGLMVSRQAGGGPIAVQLEPDQLPGRPWWQSALMWLGGTMGVLVLAAAIVLGIYSCR